MKRYVERHVGGGVSQTDPASFIDLSSRKLVGLTLVQVSAPSGTAVQISFETPVSGGVAPVLKPDGTPIVLNPMNPDSYYPLDLGGVSSVAIVGGPPGIPVPPVYPVLMLFDATFEES